MVVKPPSMLPLVGCESDKSSVWCAKITSSWYAFHILYQRSPTSSLIARSLQMCSAPVISDVSPKNPVIPSGSSLSYMLPTVGQDPRPVVVSDSPHFVETQSSEIEHSSRWYSDVMWTKSFAAQLARRMVSKSPFCSIENSATGLPVARMPSAIRLVQPGSIPITTTAATFGFAPVPIIVRKCNSRSSPNCKRP